MSNTLLQPLLCLLATGNHVKHTASAAAVPACEHNQAAGLLWLTAGYESELPEVSFHMLVVLDSGERAEYTQTDVLLLVAPAVLLHTVSVSKYLTVTCVVL